MGWVMGATGWSAAQCAAKTESLNAWCAGLLKYTSPLQNHGLKKSWKSFAQKTAMANQSQALLRRAGTAPVDWSQ
jgi:hypothetical protein